MTADRLKSAPLPPWPGEFERAGSGELFVRRAAPTSAGAEPAVLVHGLGGSATNWTDLMGLLRDRLDAVAPDLPGFGWSPPPHHDDYSLRAHVQAVVALIEAEGRGAVHLAGNSLGGTVAMMAAAARPDLVRTLTLVSPALPVYLPRMTNVHMPALAAPYVGQRLARRMGSYPADNRVRATLALCFADPARVAPQRFEEAVAEATRRADLDHEFDAVLESLRGLLSAYFWRGPSGLWATAARVTAPTLLVYGLKDKLVDPRTATRAARTFGDCRLVALRDSGHVAQMEHPEIVAKEVRRLLDEYAASGVGATIRISRGSP